MSKHTFLLNGRKVGIDAASNVRLVWVLRGVLGVRAIEGLAKPVSPPAGTRPAPETEVPAGAVPCGYCRPGRIMAATALITRVKKSGRKISEADLDTLRNVCRCGTYPRIRDAVKYAAAKM